MLVLDFKVTLQLNVLSISYETQKKRSFSDDSECDIMTVGVENV